MRISHQPDVHLTYCLNVHPGETWAENLEAIRSHALPVRERVSPGLPFGLGLRLSAQAARELAEPAALESFASFLLANDLYVFTVNAFPYGRFHGGRVKERVYHPDWSTDARRDYTNQVGNILAALLPEGQDGSISTVPGAFKLMVRDKNDQRSMAERMMDCVAHLAALERKTGREIHLGLEPEPACFLETTEEAVSFFNDVLLIHGRDYLARMSGEGDGAAEQWIRRHLGVCIDTCHAALQFEDPAEVLNRYRGEGIRISKIQLSAALEVSNTEAARMALRAYDEPVYLHQVRARTMDGKILRWNDLPDALASLPRQPMAEAVRVHYHVPLFWKGAPPLDTTAVCLDQNFRDAMSAGACSHVEIETYTFDVLPDALKAGSIEESIAREFAWVRENVL